MVLGYLTFLTALVISAVAIYYSVAGLAAIFAAAVVPIIIMGVSLEVGKLVTAVWLHKYWKRATWWLRTYLSLAVIVLMFITSMGIFGFLSKAHIEQTSASQASVSKVEQIDQEIARQVANVGRAENRIRQLEGSGTGADAGIQSQIDREKERIDNAYKRIQPVVDEQQQIIDGQGKIFRDELAKIDEQLAILQGYIDAGGRENIQRAQQMVGARADGAFGPSTAQAFRDWQTARQQERAELLTKIEQATNNPQARAARNEIQRLRRTVETEIAESNKLINRLRGQIGKQDNSIAIQKDLDEQNERIRTASSEIDKLTEEKFALQAEYRKLEAEVGPIKYIAEFIYGNTADNNMLEEAVRWVIVVIIFVFDPLAVLLLIASQYTFNWHRQEKSQQKEGQKNDIPMEKTNTDANATVRDLDTEDNISNDAEAGNTVEQTEVQSDGLTADEIARPYSEIDKPLDSGVEVVADEPVEKKDTSLEVVESTAPLRLTEEQLAELDNLEEWQHAKTAWKDENPNMSLKFFKSLYLQGKIDKLPWEDYLVEKNSYMMKEGNQQVKKTAERIKPDLTEVIEPEGYIQNEEQKEKGLWKRIRRDDEQH